MSTMFMGAVAPDAIPVHLEIDGLTPNPSVLEVHARFGLSELFDVRLVVAHATADLRSSPVLGKEARVTFLEELGGPLVRGAVRAVQALPRSTSGMQLYEVSVVPWLWALTRRRGSRIFRDLDVAGLARAIVATLGDGKTSLESELKQSYRRHEYTVQYAETDHDALFRLLAEDGVAAFFDFAKNTALVLSDDTASSSASRSVTLPFIPPSGQTPSPIAHVHEIAPQGELCSSNVTVRDHWEANPDFQPEGDADAGEWAVLSVFDYRPGAGDAAADLKQQADAHLAEVRVQHRQVKLRGNAFVAPGHRVRVEGSQWEETAEDLLVVRATCSWVGGVSGGAPIRSHELLCIPAATRFAPPRLPKPRVHGIQSACVVGQGEIDVDADGRVACRFRWDDLSVSRRVRVSQGWAGPGYGLVTLPRVGDEVLVSYLDGDADEPVITGRVHNGKNRSPLSLPADQTVSVWRTKSSPGADGYNEIRMDDAAERERFVVHAQRDFEINVERHVRGWVGGDTNHTIDGDQRLEVKGRGNVHYHCPYQFTAPKGELDTQWELNLKSNLVKVTAAHRVDTTDGNYTHDAGAVYYNTKDTFKVSGPVFEVQASTGIHLVCGGSKIEILDGEINIKSSGPVNINGTPINLNC